MKERIRTVSRGLAVAAGLALAATACYPRQRGGSSLGPSANASVIPHGCSPLHGGIPGTAAKPARWRQGARRPSTTSSPTVITVHALRAADGSPVADAHVSLANDPASSPLGSLTDSTGYAIVHATAGRAVVRVLRVGASRYVDTVTVRAGFADTLQLLLGTDPLCFM